MRVLLKAQDRQLRQLLGRYGAQLQQRQRRLRVLKLKREETLWGSGEGHFEYGFGPYCIFLGNLGTASGEAGLVQFPKPSPWCLMGVPGSL